MRYPDSAWERAMKVQEVLLKALGGQIHWFRAAEILGVSPRTMRRYRAVVERYGYAGLMDRRRARPSMKRAPGEELSRILRLYSERYAGWNVRHFHQTVQREHDVRLSYTFVRKALQEAGLVKRKKSRGRHRRRRERKAQFGEMLHMDGSRHEWLALAPGEKQTLLVVVDDATSRLLYAQLWPSESTRAVMTAMFDVVRSEGIPASIYTDRASWAFETPKAGDRVSKTHLTVFGTVLKRLGVEHIPSYSPQARGRSERMNGTLQGRLVNELKLGKARTLEQANAYIKARYLKTHNEAFAHPARDEVSAFVPVGDVDLAEVFCADVVRQVGKDNTVTCGKLVFQIRAQPNRRTCAGLSVTLRQHLDGRWSIRRGAQVWGWFQSDGRPMDAAGPVESRKRTRLSTRTLDRRPTAAGAPQRPQASAANV